MGLHCGYIAATASQSDLMAHLARHTGEFEELETHARTEDAEPDGGELEVAVGEHDGRAFLLDTSFLLSSSEDMIVALSADLGTVLGCGAETVSGSFWLTLARDGELLRMIFVQRSGSTRGMAIGEPLPFEAETPLDDPFGDGVFAALRGLGFDPGPWFDSGPATVYRYTCERSPAAGPIAQLQREHFECYGRPEGEWLGEVTVTARPMG